MNSLVSRSIFAITVLTIFILVPVSVSLPFIVFHGIGDQCSNDGLKRFTENLSKASGSPGYCIEIGNGVADSWLKPMTEQAQIACDKIKSMKELSEGYNIVAQSQGSLIARGIVEFCFGGPAVRNLITLGGPHAGTAALPKCASGLVCKIANQLIKSEVYMDYIQDHLAPSNYIKLPNSIPKYLEKSKYLTKVNNEIVGQRNPEFKARFSSLSNLILIMFEDDKILVPKETAWFGYYADGSTDTLLTPQQTKLYTEDWIGLKALNDAGKVKFIRVAGGHVEISPEDLRTHVVPYLKN